MQIDISEANNVSLITVTGKIDSTTADEFGTSLNEMLAGGANQIVMNLEGVDYMSSAGLRQLIATLKKLQPNDGDLRLAAPTEHVLEVFTLSGLSSVFSIYDTQQDAINSFRPIT